GKICPSASPPPMGVTFRGNGNKTDKGDISTLQARGHFYLALTTAAFINVVFLNDSSISNMNEFEIDLLGQSLYEAC
ncbi:MAG: hypothetical protein ABIR84_06265, partial [Candidatus Nitrotoga sp.]